MPSSLTLLFLLGPSLFWIGAAFSFSKEIALKLAFWNSWSFSCSSRVVQVTPALLGDQLTGLMAKQHEQAARGNRSAHLRPEKGRMFEETNVGEPLNGF